MDRQLLSEFDVASEDLDWLAGFASAHRLTIESRLGHDVTEMKLHGIDNLVPRWVRRPLDAVRAFERAHRRALLALDAAREELAGIEQLLERRREAGQDRDAAPLARKAAHLLCYEADLVARLERPVEDRIAAAREGVARVLEVSMGWLANETARLARGGLGTIVQARDMLAAVESYNQLAEEAASLTRGMALPVFMPEFVARLRRKSQPAAAPGPRPLGPGPTPP